MATSTFENAGGHAARVLPGQGERDERKRLNPMATQVQHVRFRRRLTKPEATLCGPDQAAIRLGPARATRLHHFFEYQARRRPDALAVDFVETGQRLTYAELDDRSAQFARHLVRLGVVANDRIALHLPRGIDVYVAMLGVLRARA